MKQGDLSAIAGSLRFAIRDLHSRWGETKEIWSDQVAVRFEENHVAPLEEPVQNALKAIDRLGAVMMRAYEECSPDRD